MKVYTHVDHAVPPRSQIVACQHTTAREPQLFHYIWHPQKPFFALRFAILEPKEFAGKTISGRLYCTPKALWKLSWFLREFGYDVDLLGRDEVDEKALPGLRGIVRVSRTTLNGRSFPNFDGFAPAGEWEELSAGWVSPDASEEVSRDL